MKRDHPRRAWIAVGSLSLVLGTGTLAPGAAQAPGLALAVAPNQALYYAGDPFAFAVAAANSGLSVAADFYAGILAPDGVTLATFGPDGLPALGNVANLTGLRPLATNVSLATPFSVPLSEVFRYVWTGTEPLGAYTAFLVALRAGSLADGRADPGDLLGLQTAALTLLPPAQTTLETGQAASALIPPEGGTLGATSTAGHHFTLTVPAGALLDPVTVTLTPVASLTGLPLTGPPLAAVRAEPAGLLFRLPATLAVTLPAPPPFGVVGFTLNDDGTGFAPQPPTVAGATLSMPVTHFSTKGWGVSFCGPTVTSAIGRDACREMAESLAFAAGLAGQLDSLPLPVRVQLAAELITQLRIWIERFIVPSLDEATDPAATDRTVDYFFFVALREFDAIRAVLELTTALDPAAALASEVAFVTGLLPQAVQVRRQVMNDRCVADKPGYRTHVADLLRLAGEADRLGLPVDPVTRGIDCLRVNLVAVYPDPVPVDGGQFQGVAELLFSDGFPVLAQFGPQPRVTMELQPLAATIAPPAFADGPGSASLSTTVGPAPGVPTLVEFRVDADVPELGLFRRQTVTRCPSASASTATATRAAARAAAAAQAEDQCPAPPEVTVDPEVSAKLTLTAQACSSPLSCPFESFSHVTPGETSAAEPLHEISQPQPEEPSLTATASGEASAVVAVTTGAVVTIAGTLRAGGRAEVQGSAFGQASSRPGATAHVRIGLGAPYQYVLNVTIDPPGSNNRVLFQEQDLGTSGSMSGVTRPGETLEAEANGAVAEVVGEGSASASATVTFTLTLTPVQ
jgi:hypothetical protein